MARWPRRVVALLDAVDVAAETSERAGEWERELAAAMPPFPPPLGVIEGSTRWREPHGSAFTKALGLSAAADLPLPSTGVRRLLVGDGLIAFTSVAEHAPAGDLTIWSADSAALERVLAAAHDTGMRPMFETVSLPLVDDLPSFKGGGHAYRGDFGAVEIAVEPTAISQRRSLLGESIEVARFELQSSRRHLPHARGSARLERWAQRARVVLTERRFDVRQIHAYLSDRGAVDHLRAAVAFEEALGGLLAPATYDPTSRRPDLVLGLALVVGAPGALSSGWLESADDWDEDDPDLVPGVRPMGQGVWRWGATRLLLVGEHAERFVFCDESGVIWLWSSVTQATEVIAERPEVFLETLAIDAELWQEQRSCAASPVHIFGAAGETLARALGLAPVSEVTDAIVRHWVNDDIWIRELADFAANVAETRLYTASSALAVRGALAARGEDPHVRIRVFSNEPVGVSHRNALAAAGLDTPQTLLASDVPQNQPR